MEPRPHERGKLNSGRDKDVRRTSFNGATSSRTWKATALDGVVSLFEVLQWSHVLTNVERLMTLVDLMGVAKPLQWSHVLTNVESGGGFC